MLSTILSIFHVIACIFLILVVLLQQGRAGGLGSAFGGATTQQVFGGRGAGNLLTRLTAIFATIFMLTSITLAYLASAGDIKLKAKPSATSPLATSELPMPPSAKAPAPSAPTPPATESAPTP